MHIDRLSVGHLWAYRAATGAWWPFNRADRATREAAAESPVQIVRARSAATGADSCENLY